MLKFSPGQYVRIRSDLEPNKWYGGDLFLTDMVEYLGKRVQIKSTLDGLYYNIVEDPRGFYFAREMFENELLPPENENTCLEKRVEELEALVARLQRELEEMKQLSPSAVGTHRKVVQL